APFSAVVSATAPCATTLLPGQSCGVSVSFAPTVGGALNGSLVVTSDDPAGPFHIPLRGTGIVPLPVVNLGAASLTFPTQLTGTTSATQTVTISNTGNAALNASSASLVGANPTDFTQTNTCVGVSVAPGASCSASVAFRPTAGGARAASLSITDNAANSPHAVALSATGVVPAPLVPLAPASLAFPTQLTGTTSATQTVTVSNTGNGALTVSSVAMAGASPGDYTQTNTC